MNSKNWKFFVLMPVAVLLTACQHGSDEPASTPGSPFAGLWVSSQSTFQLSECRRLGGTRFQGAPSVDTIGVQGDGQVFRYANREVWANANARKAWKIGTITSNGEFQRASNMTVGTFRLLDGNRLSLMNMQGVEQESYVRTTETQLQHFHMEMQNCMRGGGGAYDPRQGPDPRPGWQQQLPPWQQPGYQRPPVPGEQGWGQRAQVPQQEQPLWQQSAPPRQGQWAATPQAAEPAAPMPPQQEAYPPGYSR